MCGIFGVYLHPEASVMTYLGLQSLQHRGQESAGIVSTFIGDENIYSYKSMGLVQDVFDKNKLSELKGNIAIGHVRYPTTGEKHIKNAQPLLFDCHRGTIAISHNGDLTNGMKLRNEFACHGTIFQSTSDTEIIAHLLAKSKFVSLEDSIVETLLQIEGAYSLLLLIDNTLVACRDPMGFRPLSLGKLDDAYIFSSESCAFDLIGAQFIRDIDPGEIFILKDNVQKSLKPFPSIPTRMCIFEHIYFARPDSQIDGQNIYNVRKLLGKELALEHPVQCDMVIPVPDSGVPGALGYSSTLNVPFELGLIRSHYTGRTFIIPEQQTRDLKVKLKFNVLASLLRNKKVVVVDDSIVRGTTSKILVRMLREAGVSEVHLRITSPPVKWSCYYGIDTPRRQDLIAASFSLDEISDFIDADSIAFLSLDGTMRAVNGQNSFCDACFSGNYPTKVPSDDRKHLTIVR